MDIEQQTLSWIPLLVLAWLGVGTALLALCRTRAEPRRLSNGVWVLLAALLLIAAAMSWDGALLRFALTTPWLPLLLPPVVLLPLIAVLSVGGAQMVRRRGPTPLALLPLLLAAVLVAVALLPFAALRADGEYLLAGMLFVALGAAYLGAGFVLYLCYSRLYARLVRGARGDWVVVLGSGLSGGRRVPPLLEARIRAGLAAANRTGARLVVMSGGQGSDEAIPEGRAMREWAEDPAHGSDAGTAPRILSEERSENTEQNLRFTRQLLEREGARGPGIIATSGYHCMRAAMLARELGIDAQAVGAPVARSYWPSAVVREFAALLRRYWLRNLVAGLLLAAPLPALLLWVSPSFGPLFG